MANLFNLRFFYFVGATRFMVFVIVIVIVIVIGISKIF